MQSDVIDEQCRMLYISVFGGRLPEWASVPNRWDDPSVSVGSL
jgi:hypothetical protein